MSTTKRSGRGRKATPKGVRASRENVATRGVTDENRSYGRSGGPSNRSCRGRGEVDPVAAERVADAFTDSGLD